MIEKDITVRLKFGLHARPASLIVSKLGPLKLDSGNMTCKGLTVDLKSVLGLLTLAADTGAVARVRISGPDAEAAMAYVEQVLNAENFETAVNELQGR
jgi:phosphotransferase system HPr (HPr) family protein